jgi:fumarate hydratase class II
MAAKGANVETASGQPGSSGPIHPGDEASSAQSANGTFPAVMRIAAIRMLVAGLPPSLTRLREAAARKSGARARDPGSTPAGQA